MPHEATRRETIPAALRDHIWARDGGACVACGGRQQLHIDHIVPVAKGGVTDASNLQLLCAVCNLRKGARIGGLRR